MANYVRVQKADMADVISNADEVQLSELAAQLEMYVEARNGDSGDFRLECLVEELWRFLEDLEG
ncbi:hypothetical protein [Longispora urticae]